MTTNRSRSAQLNPRRFAHLAQWTGALSAAVVLAAAAISGRAQDEQRAALSIDSARISIAGTTNVHDYTVATSAARVTRAQFARPTSGPNVWDDLVRPGALETLEVVVPAATLASPKGDLDKNMHKALQVEKFPNITFRLRQLEGANGGELKATGSLTIAGVERDVTFTLATRRKAASLVVSGDFQLLMTDYGITPPKAMLGMLKTNPKVIVSFEAVLGVPLT